MQPSSPVDATGGESRGISSVIGFVIVVTVIIVSVTVIVGLGSTALDDTMDRSEQRLAEHTMTLFDSRAAMVALGSSDAQTLSFSQDSGTVEIRPNVGQLTIEHLDYDGGSDEILFDKSLGSMVYVNGDTEIAYQGGGIWRQTAGSDARMVSPPEFHYRGATLTLPVVRVTGGGNSATSPRVTIRSGSETTRIFPSDLTYDGAESPSYENPLDEGRVRITVKSPYYEGWASYARQRTSADVRTFDRNETVRLTLESLSGSPGGFGVPLEGDSLEVDGLGSGHPITDFTLTLKADGNFQNAHWSLYSTEQGDEFEMHIYSPSQCSGDSYDDTIDFSLYYYNDSTGEVREWQNTGITVGENSAFDVSCEDEEMYVNFTTENTDLTYQEISTTGSNNKWCFGEHIQDRDIADGDTLSSHSPVHSKKSLTTTEHTESMNFTVNHYMSRMGSDYDLTVTDGAGNSECLSSGRGKGSSNVDEAASSGNFEFRESAEAKFLTYLHVTENRIEISLK